MTLFPKSILDDVRRIPGARHSFLRHLVEPDGESTRHLLETTFATVDGPVADRWREMIHSLDNRVFMQGFAELACHSVLSSTGWRALHLQEPGPLLVYADPTGAEADVMVLSFIRQLRPNADHAIIRRLVQSLDRVGARSRVAVVVRRWLPHNFDPEPVRRAIEMWLQEVDRGGWDGRYAAYDDENISLEFALTGERVKSRGRVVAFTLGPQDALRTLERVQRSLIAELDKWRHAVRPDPSRPLLAMCVSDQPWGLSRGYVREMLVGKPVKMTTGPEGFQVHLGVEQSPSLLRDPLQNGVQGIFFVDRTPKNPNAIRAKGYLNPWALRVRDPRHFACPVMATTRQTLEGPVLRWFTP